MAAETLRLCGQSMKISNEVDDKSLGKHCPETEAEMNVLIYDAPKTVCHLVKSLLLTQKHRAAISVEPEDAILKLETGLFDILVSAPAGAPAEMAEHVEREFPNLPVVLAGVPVQ